MSDTQKKAQAKTIAQMLIDGFNRHFRIFQNITSGARERFEQADWQAERQASRERIVMYDKRVNETIEQLKQTFTFEHLDESLWRWVKFRYIRLLLNHHQPELAETFYNSVFCRLLHRTYFDNDHIFVRSATSTEYIEHEERAAYYCYYPGNRGMRHTITCILEQPGFSTPYEQFDRDTLNIRKALCSKICDVEKIQLNFQLQVLNAVFYRNRAAYIIGRAINGYNSYPFALPVLNNEKGGLYVDAVLLGEEALSRLFEFSYVYFMVEHPVPSAIVHFLKQLMPQLSTQDLYSAIGFHKHGKTDFYRDYLHHMKYSDDKLIIAPGTKGMVMAVFTLPSYPYVFKIIRDRFAPPKNMSRKQVEEKYQLVKRHDRVGRMADTLEYSYVAFPRDRFSEGLMEELKSTCASSIEFEDDKIVIKHLYLETRMMPLNMDLAEADEARIDTLMRGYGEAIRELAAANIFPGDMLLKNFGVTQFGRVVFYDYDEVCYLTDCNFRRIPPPRYPEDEWASEPWYSVNPNDVFPEEFATFLLGDLRYRKAFMKYHADLLTPEFWWKKQENIRQGVYEEVFPYPKAIRFS